MPRSNAFGQPVGEALDGWMPPARPARRAMPGRYCSLEPFDAAVHAADMWQAYGAEPDASRWTYLSHGPYDSFDEYHAWATRAAASADPLFFAVVTPTPSGRPRAAGVAAYLRIATGAGSIEVGHLHFATALAKTPAATEALFLLIDGAFAAGYRRCEWKCDALNAPSRVAAKRLGFVFEGVFRQALVYKGRNRDTAWYAIVDGDWPRLREAFLAWLDPSNFAADGRQRTRLSALTARHQSAADPSDF